MTPIEIIKQSVSVRDVCDAYGIQVNRAGFACCPFHGEKTPSMKVYDGARGFFCFGCHQGGDVIDFAKKYFGLPTVDAEKRLSEDFGLGLTFDQSGREARKKASEEAYRRRKAFNAWKRESERLWKEYDEALTTYTVLDKIITDGRELACAGIITDDFADALRSMETAQVRLYDAEWKLKQHGQTRPEL